MQQAVSVPSTHAGHALPSNPGALSVPSIRAALRRARVEIEEAAEIKRATPPPGLCWVLGTKRKGALPREFSLSAAVWFGVSVLAIGVWSFVELAVLFACGFSIASSQTGLVILFLNSRVMSDE